MNFIITIQKMKNYLFLLPFILLFSCQEKNKSFSEDKFDRMLRDTLYKRKWIIVEHQNNLKEEVELYITKDRDTFVNQYKSFVNGVLDTLYSQYYELEILDTEKEHFYRAKIKFYHKFNNLKDYVDKTSKFRYLSQNKDSLYLNELEIDSSEIEFVFENFYEKRLQGCIDQIIFTVSESIRNGEEMLDVNWLELAVDSHIYTDNLFFKTAEHQQKFNPYNLKLEKKEQ